MQGPWASCCPGPLLVSFGPSPLFFLGEENNDLFATTPDLLKKKKSVPFMQSHLPPMPFSQMVLVCREEPMYTWKPT
jgi:hypothetical protein